MDKRVIDTAVPRRGRSSRSGAERWDLVFVLAALTSLAGCPPTHDRVLFNNPNAAGDIGILLDAQVDGAAVNDKTYTAPANGHVDPGDVRAGARNEVIAYQQERPVSLVENAAWTDDPDDVTVNFAPEMGVGFFVWLLKEPFSARQTQAVAACIKLDQIWQSERMGTQIATFQVNDRTTDPARAPFLDFTCADAADIRSQIGFNSGGVNIYYVDRVDFGNGFSTGNGVWCGNNTVVMGSGASDHLAAHETGHAFSLDHVNALTTNFDTSNVMHNASNNRQYLTEGQTLRAHFTPGSVINSTYNLRSGLPTRNCASLSETAAPDCPAVQKRIWADGSFPPN